MAILIILAAVGIVAACVIHGQNQTTQSNKRFKTQLRIQMTDPASPDFAYYNEMRLENPTAFYRLLNDD